MPSNSDAGQIGKRIPLLRGLGVPYKGSTELGPVKA